jgi:outer membrane protein assembly factor BamB
VLLVAVTVVLLLAAPLVADESRNDHWPQWRGPLGTGVAPQADPPIEWNETKNIRWKVALPGKGHSTPIIWGDRVFITTAIPYGDKLEPKYSGRTGAHDNLPVAQRHEFVVIAVNRGDGTIIWQRSVHRALPHEGGHYTASLASSSPVTDGEHVFAFFGSYGLYCLDLDGKLQWKTDLGDMHSKHGHGEGSSPALYGDTLVVNWDHEEQSFLVAFDKRSNAVRWKLSRDEVTSWATPIIVQHDGDPQLIVSGTDRVRGYDLATGRVVWECGGLSANIVASPVAADGMVFAGSSYEKRALLAIRLDGAEGDITSTKHVAWTRITGTPYVPSPLLYGNSLYYLRHYQGILSRVNIKTGADDGGPFRLGLIRDVYASPVAAANRIYITGLDGTTQVISHGANPEVLAVNQLNDSISASAALVGRELFLRGERNLYCVAKK